MTSPGVLSHPGRLPESVVPLLTDLLDGMSRVIPEMIGVWVYGSVALGAFDVRTSDIDLIVATDAHLSDDRIDRLSILHEDLAGRHTLGSRLDVQYLMMPELCGTVQANGYPVYREGSFLRSGRGDLNATTRWVLWEHGVSLLGPSPGELRLDVTWNDVRAAMRSNLTEYWPAYAMPAALPPLHEDAPVVWTVATLCRILSTVIDGVIVPKPAAVEIWSERVPDRWSTLLYEVRRMQAHANDLPGYASPLDRARDVQGFVVWACGHGLAVLEGSPDL